MCIYLGSGGEVEDYSKWELIIRAVHNVLLLLLTVAMYTMLFTTEYHNIPNLVAIVDSTHVESATASLEDFNIVQENTTADILIDDHYGLQLDRVTVDQEGELHKPINSRTKHESFVVEGTIV